MAAVKKYRVISEGIEFGDTHIATGEIVPGNRMRDPHLVDWLTRVGAVEVVASPRQAAQEAAQDAANQAEEAMEDAVPPPTEEGS